MVGSSHVPAEQLLARVMSRAFVANDIFTEVGPLMGPHQEGQRVYTVKPLFPPHRAEVYARRPCCVDGEHGVARVGQRDVPVDAAHLLADVAPILPGELRHQRVQLVQEPHRRRPHEPREAAGVGTQVQQPFAIYGHGGPGLVDHAGEHVPGVLAQPIANVPAQVQRARASPVAQQQHPALGADLRGVHHLDVGRAIVRLRSRCQRQLHQADARVVAGREQAGLLCHSSERRPLHAVEPRGQLLPKGLGSGDVRRPRRRPRWRVGAAQLPPPRWPLHVGRRRQLGV
mmetsp:Transcript_26644/g.83000  ORF Transcript_26644/g.83000 Transcript_26644/m.83000 type:complete len:286 (-) Transcript_26644:140-997(-)